MWYDYIMIICMFMLYDYIMIICMFMWYDYIMNDFSLQDILMMCWGYKSNARPSMSALFKALEKLPKKRLARSPSHPVQLSRSAESVIWWRHRRRDVIVLLPGKCPRSNHAILSVTSHCSLVCSLIHTFLAQTVLLPCGTIVRSRVSISWPHHKFENLLKSPHVG